MLDEESILESPLDKVDPYQVFSDILLSESPSQLARGQLLMHPQIYKVASPRFTRM